MHQYLKAIGIAAVTAAATASGWATAADDGKPRTDPDHRQVLQLPPDERHLVLDEMRRFVAAMQQITEGLAKEDFQKVASAARKMGSGAANEIPPRVVKKLPQQFRQLAGKVHTTFDAIALDAEAMGDTQLTLDQVSNLYGHCVSCHAIYQIEKVPFPENEK